MANTKDKSNKRTSERSTSAPNAGTTKPVAENAHVQSAKTGSSTPSNSGSSNENDVKQQAKELAGTAQEKAKKTAAQVQEQAAEMTEEAKRKAGEYAEEAKQQARSVAEEQKTRAASRLEGVASGLREAGREWHDQDEDPMARYSEAAADQVEQFSNYLQTHSTGDLLNEVERFARRQPEIFVAGTLAAGFLLGRFIKSSGRRDSYDGGYAANGGSTYPPARTRQWQNADRGQERWQQHSSAQPYQDSYGRRYGASGEQGMPRAETTEFTYGEAAVPSGSSRADSNVTTPRETKATETDAERNTGGRSSGTAKKEE